MATACCATMDRHLAMSALVKARDESTTGLDLWMAMSNICFTAWIKDHNHHALCTVAHPLVAHCACSWDLASSRLLVLLLLGRGRHRAARCGKLVHTYDVARVGIKY